MREIKFRAWSPKFGGMIYPGGGYDINVDEGGRVHSVWQEGRDDEGVELMQYTGLKDKHGNEIYEGDIVAGGYIPYKISEKTGEVVFDQGGFYFNASRRAFFPLCELKDVLVIGNIHENPELI